MVPGMTTAAKKKPTTNDVGINVQIPKALHRQLRVKSVANNQTLTQAVTEAVRAWVKVR